MSEIKDISGKRFGLLTVLSRGESVRGKAVWICKCDCGNEVSVNGYKLRVGETRSCGCLRKETLSKMTKKHGFTKSHLYKTWTNIKTRCHNPLCSEYERYGGRGITICKEWENFEAFMDWAIKNGYSEECYIGGRHKLSIDRINNDGNYCPENCRWITQKEQARNKSNNRFLEYRGKVYCLSELAEISTVTVDTLRQRLKKGFSVEEAVDTPSRTNKRRELKCKKMQL